MHKKIKLEGCSVMAVYRSGVLSREFLDPSAELPTILDTQRLESGRIQAPFSVDAIDQVHRSKRPATVQPQRLRSPAMSVVGQVVVK